MYNEMDILEFLINLIRKKEVEYDDYICIYESHMGGLYTTSSPLSMDDCYCEQCGDSDWEIASGWCADLILEFSEDTLNTTKDMSLLAEKIVSYVDIEDVISSVIGYYSDNSNEDDDCSDKQCNNKKYNTIEEMLEDDDIPYECKRCYIEDRIIEMWW